MFFRKQNSENFEKGHTDYNNLSSQIGLQWVQRVKIFQYQRSTLSAERE